MDIKSWTNHIIEIYDKSETVDVYNRRSNNESKNIKSVLKAIQEQKFALHSAQNRSDFIHLLKAADSISLDVGTNYLDQFLRLPDVQKIISERLTSDNLAKVTQRAKDNEQKGNLPNFPKTVAEADKSAANIFLSSDSMLRGRTPEQEILRFNKHISDILDTGIFSVKTEATTLQDITMKQNLVLRLGRVMLRQQGMNPGSMQLENGRVQFEMDVPDKEPIFHRIRQENGLSIAQQEELKKKQEAEQRHQQEQRANNQYSIDSKKKREEDKKANEESSTKMSAKDVIMEQARKYKSQRSNSNSFMESLRVNVENTNRTNQLQNQSHTQKRSRGMGISR